MAESNREMPQGGRKAQVLHALDVAGPLPTGEVAEACGMSLSHTRNLLRKLRKRGRIETETDQLVPQQGRSESVHEIAPIGVEYLQWYDRNHPDRPDLPGLRGH